MAQPRQAAGQRLVDFDPVNVGRAAGTFDAIRLEVTGNGLRANNRCIRHVRLDYGKFANLRGPTYVELPGRRQASSPSGPRLPEPSPRRGERVSTAG